MSSFGDINRINTNILSLQSQLSLNKTNRSLGQSMLKMSTGLRINRAEDDAAGLSIANKTRSRIAGLQQALSNVGDSKSVLDIAESSFDTIMDQLVEMKALATQAANDTLGKTERQFIAKQIAALGNDINEIAAQTVFQDTNLLKGNAGGNTGQISLTFQVGERAQDTITARIDAVNVGMLFNGAGTGNAAGTTQLGATGGSITVTDLASLSGTEAGTLTFATDANGADFRAFISSVDTAIERMADRVNTVGISQRSLSIREVTLSSSISANSSAVSRIMDLDFAKEMSNMIRLQILQQTSTSALAQANIGPQSVLGFLR
ncbi:MAG: flagellin [Bacteroidetes bacterium]|nr:flagellin [Bacteroidota bacterium]